MSSSLSEKFSPQPPTDAEAAQAAVDLLEFTHRQQQFLADAVAFSREVLAAAERAAKLASAVARSGHTSSQRQQQAEINKLHATTATEAARSVLRLQIAVQDAQRASIGAAAAFAHRHEAATFLKIDDDSAAQAGSDTKVRLNPEADGEDSGQEFFDGIAIDAADHLEENDDDGYYDQWERGGGRVW